MRAGQALAGLQFGLSVASLVLKHILKNISRAPHGGPDRFHCGIAQLQMLTPSGKVSVNGGGRLLEPPDKMGTVMNEHRSRLGQLLGQMAGGLPAADCGCAAGGDDTRLYARSGETPDAGEDAGNGLLSGGCDCRLGTGCDCDRHSTEIELYTSSHSDDNEKAVRCIVAELPPSLAAEFGHGVSLTIHQGISFIVSDPLPLEGVVAVVGRRAPPFRA